MPKKTVKKDSAKPHLENDFERMIPEYHKGGIIYAEHIVRYEAAAEIVKGKVILDIASGSGYGTALLAQSAKKVYGVDVSDAAVAYAGAHYGAANIEYKQGDGEKIPLDDASVDVVVSFETIEHIQDYTQFMREVKRVLKPDGLLLLSTPNDSEFVEGNHFHLHEFEHDELKKLVGDYFSQTKEYFQGTWVCSAIGDEKLLNSEWEAPVKTLQAAPIDIEKALYFFMLCANRPITEEVTPRNAIGEHWSARVIKEQGDKTDAAFQNEHHQTKVLQEELERVRADRDRLHYELSAIKNSRAWAIANRIHEINKKVRRKDT